MENVSKAQLVDYIANNFKRDGKKITKKSLNDLSMETLRTIVTKNNCEAQLQAWINRPKLIKYLVDGKRNGKEYSWNCEFASEEDCRKAFEEDGIEIFKIATASDHHRCRYCDCIADGKEKDLLCDDCRSIFGHAYYSEL